MSGLLAFVGFLALVAAGVLVFLALKHQRRADLAGLPLKHINRLTRGLCKTKGKVVAFEKPLSCPLTDEPCVYYDLFIEEENERWVLVKKGDSMDYEKEIYWVALVRERELVAAGIEDETGQVEIELEHAEIEFKGRERTRGGIIRGDDLALQRNLRKRYPRQFRGIGFDKPVRFRQTIIQEGDNLLVIGDVEEDGSIPRFTRGRNPLIVSDRSSKQMQQQHASSTTTFWIGAGAALAASVVLFILAAVLPGQR
jgi:hypothetical protein